MNPKQLSAIALLPCLKQIKGFDEEDFFSNIENYSDNICMFIHGNAFSIYYTLKDCIYIDWTYAKTFKEKKLIYNHFSSLAKKVKIQLANNNFWNNHTEHIHARYYYLYRKSK